MCAGKRPVSGKRPADKVMLDVRAEGRVRDVRMQVLKLTARFEMRGSGANGVEDAGVCVHHVRVRPPAVGSARARPVAPRRRGARRALAGVSRVGSRAAVPPPLRV